MSDSPAGNAMKGIEFYLESNRDLWDRLVPIHARSRYYDVDGFRHGGSTLMQLEREEVGDVRGKTLLHLQCHFGLDTLSWSRQGARVTGADFSPAAIDLARALSAELAIPARFLCTNLFDLSAMLADRFDIIFTSYGVLCWLPDLGKWADVVAHFLNPGGFFYIAEGHPLVSVFANESDMKGLQVTGSYFHSPEPTRWETDVSYADPRTPVNLPSFEWTHSLADILNALIRAGLRIDFLHEFPFSFYQHFPFLMKGGDGYWHLPQGDLIPMTFSLKATKP